MDGQGFRHGGTQLQRGGYADQLRAQGGAPLQHGGSRLGEELWVSKMAHHFVGCSDATKDFAAVANAITESNRYLMIATSGGLNLQRTGIIDAAVAACILNATLVIPKLDQASIWKDASSDFGEIFDADSFISSLPDDLNIIRQVPDRNGNTPFPCRMCVPRECTPKCTACPFKETLLETDLQKLSCRVNYHALRFTDPILEMGRLLVKRTRAKSGRFIALHLRFEPDMLAFSGCYFGGGEIERRELVVIRKRWNTLHESNLDRGCRHGKCALTPEEVGFMLRAFWE